jgi:hypothetical protein
MEYVAQLMLTQNLTAENGRFWWKNWPFIAAANVPLELKVATYYTLKERNDDVNINHVDFLQMYELVRCDRAFVAELDMNNKALKMYRACAAWQADDVVALNHLLDNEGYRVECLLLFDAPHCMRLLMGTAPFRKRVMRNRMSPMLQKIVEELVLPGEVPPIVVKYGQSVKLAGMCAADAQLVGMWLKEISYIAGVNKEGTLSVSFARKVYALATPAQRLDIRGILWKAMNLATIDEGWFELARLDGLIGNPTVAKHALTDYKSLFPAMVYAMIVGTCDGFFNVRDTSAIKRFFVIAGRLPMDLQALVSLRGQKNPASVITATDFDVAFRIATGISDADALAVVEWWV